jgi:DNA-binding NtrC family response regulator
MFEPAAHILVVDDDEAVRNVLKTILESSGYTVSLAANGRVAMEMMQDGNFDLIITDLVMPEQEGIETIKRIRKEYPSIRVIAMSGAFGGDYLRIASLLGAHSTLPKPIRMEAVLSAVENALEAE